MTIAANSRLKACDPFCTRKPIKDVNENKDKVVKTKTVNKLPRSLKMVMEGAKLVKEIEEKKKLRQQQEQERRLANIKKEEEKKKQLEQKKIDEENNLINQTNQQQTMDPAIKAMEASKQLKNETLKKQKNKQKRKEAQKKKEKKSKSLVDENLKQQKNKQQEVKKNVDTSLDTSEEYAKLYKIYGGREEDVPEDDNTIDITNNLKRRQGETIEQFKDRINRVAHHNLKTSSNSYKKMKDHFAEKKLKEKLKKQGIKYSEYLNNQRREQEEEEKQKRLEEKGLKQQQKQQKKRNFDDFSELKDEVKFGEQANRPPTELPRLKDFATKKQAESVKSSNREYLWQTQLKEKRERESKKFKSNNDDEDDDNENENNSREEIKKRGIEILKARAKENYQQTKKRRQQLLKIENEKNLENPNNNNNKPQFYL
eukprot:gene1009-1279_t